MTQQTVFVSLYATAEYACSYLPNRRARSQVATPTNLINTEIYSQLVQQGFRRSGDVAYRPWCDQCTACIPVRINVSAFQPTRSQQRAWKQHSDLTFKELPLAFKTEHFELYTTYQSVRHQGGGMDKDTEENYRQFLLGSLVDSRLIEFSLNDTVCMVSLIDVLEDGLSSVYTFYDPMPNKSGKQNSFGTYNILWQVHLCQALGLPYLYLGYWVKDSQKMDYKRKFSPLEGLINGTWSELSC